MKCYLKICLKQLKKLLFSTTANFFPKKSEKKHDINSGEGEALKINLRLLQFHPA